MPLAVDGVIHLKLFRGEVLGKCWGSDSASGCRRQRATVPAAVDDSERHCQDHVERRGAVHRGICPVRDPRTPSRMLERTWVGTDPAFEPAPRTSPVPPRAHYNQRHRAQGHRGAGADLGGLGGTWRNRRRKGGGGICCGGPAPATCPSCEARVGSATGEASDAETRRRGNRVSADETGAGQCRRLSTDNACIVRRMPSVPPGHGA